MLLAGMVVWGMCLACYCFEVGVSGLVLDVALLGFGGFWAVLFLEFRVSMF